MPENRNERRNSFTATPTVIASHLPPPPPPSPPPPVEHPRKEPAFVAVGLFGKERG